MRKVPDMSELVTAEVILRSADGTSILDAQEGITAANIAEYQVGKEVIEEASEKLTSLGFRVLQTGPVSLTISADKELFQRVFQAKIEPHSTDLMDTKVRGVETTYYEAVQPVDIPEEFSSLVADVVLPTPPMFFP
jgi:hypothetical protein